MNINTFIYLNLIKGDTRLSILHGYVFYLQLFICEVLSQLLGHSLQIPEWDLARLIVIEQAEGFQDLLFGVLLSLNQKETGSSFTTKHHTAGGMWLASIGDGLLGWLRGVFSAAQIHRHIIGLLQAEVCLYASLTLLQLHVETCHEGDTNSI